MLNERPCSALGGAGNGEAFLTIAKARLSNASRPLLSRTFAEITLPSLSILRSSSAVPCQPRLCAILGYDLCFAMALPNKRP